jgi:hypothetical protein
MHLQEYTRKDAIRYPLLEGSAAALSHSEGKCGSHLLVHALLSDAFPRTLMRILCLRVESLITEASCPTLDEKGREPHFGRKSDNARNCHTSFRNCQSQSKFAPYISNGTTKLDRAYLPCGWRASSLTQGLTSDFPG